MVFDTAIIFAVVAAIGFGVADMWSSIPARKIPAQKIVVCEQIMVACMFWVMAGFLQPGTPLITPTVIGLSILGGGSLVIAIRALFESLAVGKVGVVAPIFNADALVAAVLGVIIFNEVLSISQYISFVLVFVGIFLLGANLQSWRSVSLETPGLKWALLAMLMFGVSLVSYKALTEYVSSFHTVVIVNLVAVVFALMTTRGLFSKEYFSDFDLKMISHIFGISLVIVAAVFLMVSAFSLADLSVVSVIVGTSPLVSSLLAYAVFKERLTVQQYIGGIVAVVGVMLLAIL